MQAVVNRISALTEVAVGNPARVIKERFDHELVDLLVSGNGGTSIPEDLKQHESIFFENIGKPIPDVLSREYLKKILYERIFP